MAFDPNQEYEDPNALMTFDMPEMTPEETRAVEAMLIAVLHQRDEKGLRVAGPMINVTAPLAIRRLRQFLAEIYAPNKSVRIIIPDEAQERTA